MYRRARTEERRAAASRLRAELPAKVAEAADQAKQLSEQATRLKGRAQELVEAQLVVESDRFLAAERQLTEVNCDLEELAAERAVTDWLLDALRNFTAPSALPRSARAVALRATRPLRGLRALRVGRVWDMLTPDNKGRLLRALISKITVNELFAWPTPARLGDAERRELIELLRVIAADTLSRDKLDVVVATRFQEMTLRAYLMSDAVTTCDIDVALGRLKREHSRTLVKLRELLERRLAAGKTAEDSLELGIAQAS